MSRDFQTGFDNTGGHTGLTLEHAWSPEVPIPLHPDRSDRKARLAAVTHFARLISESLAKDYGDWMREANLHLLQLKESLKQCSEASPILDALQSLIQFTPEWRPLETCRKALDLTFQLRNVLFESEKLNSHDFSISHTETDRLGAN